MSKSRSSVCLLSWPVGLLFAGSRSFTLANPIDRVLAALGVTIVA